jgi:hypothetical protein
MDEQKQLEYWIKRALDLLENGDRVSSSDLEVLGAPKQIARQAIAEIVKMDGYDPVAIRDSLSGPKG